MDKFVTILKPTLTLLRYSSLSLEPNYSWLMDILSSNNKLSFSIINNLHNITDVQRSFLLNSLNKEANRIALEWNSIGDVPIPNTNNEPCELCGNVHCKEFYIIKNKFSNKELKVGSSCIKKYPSINKSFGTDGIDKVVRYNRLSMQKYNRENLILQHVGSRDDTFLKWSSVTFDYVLDYDNYINRENLITTFTDQYNNYINKGFLNNTDLFNSLNLLKKEIDNLDNIIIERQRESNIYDLDCPSYIETWINKNAKSLCQYNKIYSSILINIRLNNGKVDLETIKYIFQPDYISRFVNFFNSKLTGLPIVIKQIYDNKIILNIKNYNLNFYIDCKTFMYNFGSVIVDNAKEITYESLLNYITIDFNDESSLERLIDIFNYVIYNSNFLIISLESHFSRNMIKTNYFLYNKRLNMYASKQQSPPETFLKNCIKFIFQEDKKLASHNIINIIDQISYWDDFDNLKKYT